MAAQKRLTFVFFLPLGESWQEKSTTSSAEEEVGQNLLQNEPSTCDEAVSTSKKPQMFSDKWLTSKKPRMFSDKWLTSKKKHRCFLTSG